MYKRYSIISLILLVLSIFSGILQAQEIDTELMEKAKKIHEEAIVIDTHTDTPLRILRGFKLGKRQETGHLDFIRMKEGGLDAVFFAVYVPNDIDTLNPSKRAMRLLDAIYEEVEENKTLAKIAFTPDDIKRISQTGKRAVLIGIENGSPVESDLGLLRNYFRMGVRYITLTHMSNNYICDSSTDKEPRWNGLSDFGKEMVQEMNRIGMIIDVSHISDEAFWDVIELSKSPVIASHSCCKAICDVPRNLSDEMIKALAENGGVLQINFYAGFLDPHYGKVSQRLWDELRDKLNKIAKEIEDPKKLNEERRKLYFEIRKELRKVPVPTIDVMIDHIDHIVKLVGIDYVGLGSDFDGISVAPVGIDDVSDLPLITYHLLKRGYTKKEIHKILGGNFLRVFEENLKNAAKFEYQIDSK